MTSSLLFADFVELRYEGLSQNGLNNQVVAGASARRGGRLDAAAVAAARRRRRMGADTIRSAPTYWMSSTSSSSPSLSSLSPSLLQLPLWPASPFMRCCSNSQKN